MFSEFEAEGYEACYNDEPASNNPYIPGSKQFRDWAEGWRLAIHELLMAEFSDLPTSGQTSVH